METSIVFLLYLAIGMLGIYLGKLFIRAIFGQPRKTPRHARHHSSRTKWS